MVAESVRLAAKAGCTGAAIAHNSTWLETSCIRVFCTQESGQFYKQLFSTFSVQGLPELESFLPGELVTGHIIYAQILPREGMGLIPNIVEHFCAGTWYAIKPEQVKITGKAGIQKHLTCTSS